jgi:hypothetical protein
MQSLLISPTTDISPTRGRWTSHSYLSFSTQAKLAIRQTPPSTLGARVRNKIVQFLSSSICATSQTIQRLEIKSLEDDRFKTKIRNTLNLKPRKPVVLLCPSFVLCPRISPGLHRHDMHDIFLTSHAWFICLRRVSSVTWQCRMYDDNFNNHNNTFHDHDYPPCLIEPTCMHARTCACRYN